MTDKDYQNHQNQQRQQQNKEIMKPFIGPRPFTQDPEDQKLFFGRNYESEKIISLIYSHKLTLVYAQSGAGKTSLFNAQIVPELEKKGLQVLPLARVGVGLDLSDKETVDFQQSDNGTNYNGTNLYLLNMYQSLVPNVSDYFTLKNLSLSTFLKKYFPRHVSQRGKEIPQVLVFDQLEEIFNLFSDPNKWAEHQKDFFWNITGALENDPLLRILFVIREDYLAQLDPFVSILPENLKPRFRLERLREDEAVQAIKGPLEKLGYDVPIKEIEQIVRDLMKIKVETITGKSLEVIGEFIEPIHLQVVCQRWWYERFISENTNKSKSNFLSSDLTDVDKALEDFYEKSIQRAIKETNVKEEDLRKWCEENLITSSGTRSNVHLEANITKGLPNKAIEILGDSYLIRREWRAGAPWYELTHDRLIKPIKDSNKKWISKKQKSKKAFRLKIFVPIMLISIISISIFVINEIEQQRLEIKQQQERIDLSESLINQLTKGINYYGKKDYNQALLEFDKLLSVNPNHSEALYYKGLILSAQYKFDEALKYFDQALAIDPNSTFALIAKGYLFYDQNKFDEALKYIDQALAIDPNDSYALSGKGYILSDQNKFDEALTYIDQALNLNPNDSYALSGKGYIFYAQNKYDEASQFYNKALEIDPNYVYALNGKALTLATLDKNEEALPLINKVLESHSNNGSYLSTAALIMYNLEKHDDAKSYFEKALQINPNLKDTLEGKELTAFINLMNNNTKQ